MPTILVVEDEQLIVMLLKDILQAEGYQTITATTGEEALQLALREMPHLIILDIMLPGIDGFEVVNHLRSNVKTTHIPVIILSARHDTADKVRAFENRVDDYLTKPFDNDELLARVRAQLRRVDESLLSPLTGLPSGVQVERAIGLQLKRTDPWCILYLDLNNFKAYNDVYGFLRGNEFIRIVAEVCRDAVSTLGNPDDFLGHVGGDDFVILTTPDRAEALSVRITTAFERRTRSFYSPEDVQRGYFVSTDRLGRPSRFPLVDLAIGVITNQQRTMRSIEDVSRAAAEVKRKAKQQLGGERAGIVDAHLAFSTLMRNSAWLTAESEQELN
jgi:diguanylate cyclase (GGDEF)-like protein